eukprot:jgi/Chlat1/6454/Chrsp45S00469
MGVEPPLTEAAEALPVDGKKKPAQAKFRVGALVVLNALRWYNLARSSVTSAWHSLLRSLYVDKMKLVLIVLLALCTLAAGDNVTLDVMVERVKHIRRPAAGPSVRPPDSIVPNCPDCPEPIIPDMCRYAPAPLRFGDSVLEESTFKVTDESHSNLGRKLLAKKKKKKDDHQLRFTPPSATIREYALKVLTKWFAGNETQCGVWTRDCVKRYMSGDTMGLRDSPADNFQDNTMPENYLELFPDLKPGALGSCAVIAALTKALQQVGDNVLHHQRGPEIDSHDTVFRYNSPMKKYADDIGSKSDIMYWKVRSDEVQYGVEKQRASRFYMFKSPIKYFTFGDRAEIPKQTHLGLPLLWTTRYADELIYPLYTKYIEEAKITARQTPPGGYKWALQIMSSGLCTRIDMYGYTAKGTGKYFDRGATMRSVHNAGLDHWAYRLAMELGPVCIYD